MQKTKVTQIKRSNFADGNEQVEGTNFELQLLKIPELFLFDRSIHTSNLVVQRLKQKAPQTINFFYRKEPRKGQLAATTKKPLGQHQYRNKQGTIKQAHSTD